MRRTACPSIHEAAALHATSVARAHELKQKQPGTGFKTSMPFRRGGAVRGDAFADLAVFKAVNGFRVSDCRDSGGILRAHVCCGMRNENNKEAGRHQA